MLRVGALFAGVGGLELGVEAARVGATKWQVENNPFSLGVLARHWPHARRFNDVRTVGKHNLPPVDLITAGFPCQDLSTASACSAGLEGERSGLWYEALRIFGELNPSCVLIENVTSGQKRWLPVILSELKALDYRTVAVNLYASDVGATHRRARTFVLGVKRRLSNPAAERMKDWAPPPENPEDAFNTLEAYFPVRFPMGRGTEQYPWEPPRLDPEKVPYARNRLVALGNAVVPQCGYVVAVILAHLLQGRSFTEARRLGPTWLNLPHKDSWGLVVRRNQLLWPTPVASMGCRGGAKISREEKKSLLLQEAIGVPKYRVPGQYGYINPRWVERLMGFWDGWTVPVRGTPEFNPCKNFYGREGYT